MIHVASALRYIYEYIYVLIYIYLGVWIRTAYSLQTLSSINYFWCKRYACAKYSTRTKGT